MRPPWHPDDYKKHHGLNGHGVNLYEAILAILVIIAAATILAVMCGEKLF